MEKDIPDKVQFLIYIKLIVIRSWIILFLINKNNVSIIKRTNMNKKWKNEKRKKEKKETRIIINTFIRLSVFPLSQFLL